MKRMRRKRAGKKKLEKEKERKKFGYIFLLKIENLFSLKKANISNGNFSL